MASFLVEIQETQNAWNTQVVHRETDTREEWNGIAIEEVVQRTPKPSTIAW
ncbi:hypothetical protein [Baaleninema sp.]|uniref:hypothetical protein n=1 Tax=Baaleninema sp. TaxID=3101197 RepID=UPI003CFF6F4B